jgi:hypothetical protein
MPLYRIAYYGVPNPKLIDEYQALFDHMSEHAVRQGAEMDVTGVFLPSGYWVYSVIEGRRRVVSDMLGEAFRSSNQLAVQVVMAAPIARRLFNRMWGLAGLSPDQMNVMRRYSSTNAFEPGTMTPAALCSLAYELTEALRHPAPPPLIELDELAWDDNFTLPAPGG